MQVGTINYTEKNGVKWYMYTKPAKLRKKIKSLIEGSGSGLLLGLIINSVR